MVENFQGMLKDAIKQKFDIDTDEARGRLSVDILSRAYEKCESKEETLAFFRRNSGGRYDRTILNELAKSHGSDPFTLPGSFKPHDWQKQASESWKDNSYKGIVAAVTGSGKTIMAVYAIAEYVRVYPNAIFSIIVPTKVLMKQWAEVISGLLGLDDSLIGLRGDGFKDSFSDGKRVLISIVNSARGGVLEADIDQLPEDTKHVIIADECHRYGSESNRKNLQY
ncbi:MAG: DEAD/DEAH box helicase family protein [Candidatus Thalassarchaeaceae archaeon]